jgi:hypothetical protein
LSSFVAAERNRYPFTYYNKKLAMDRIPTSSQVSSCMSFWFIFRDGETEIAAHGSAITGQERIFVNGELISEKRSISKTSEHQFSVNANIYKVIFLVPHILKGKLECSLIKDGKYIRAFRMSYKYKFRIIENLIELLLVGAVGGVFSILLLFLKLPIWLVFLVIVAYIPIVISQETKNFVIDEIDV